MEVKDFETDEFDQYEAARESQCDGPTVGIAPLLFDTQFGDLPGQGRLALDAAPGASPPEYVRDRPSLPGDGPASVKRGIGAERGQLVKRFAHLWITATKNRSPLYRQGFGGYSFSS